MKNKHSTEEQIRVRGTDIEMLDDRFCVSKVM